MIGGSAAFNIIFTQTNNIIVMTSLTDFGPWAIFFSDIYIKPWARCIPYFYGLFFGMIYT